MTGKKILIGIDGSRFSENAMDYAIQLFKGQNALLVGLIMEDLNHKAETSAVPAGPLYYQYAYDIFEVEPENKVQAHRKMKNHFIDKCNTEGMKYTVHSDSGSPVEELINESKYADLIMIGYQTYFSSIKREDSEKVLSEVLKESACPVLVVPESAIPIGNLLLAYDGKESAFHAIRQFAYLFPDLIATRNTTLLTAFFDEDGIASDEDNRRFMEFMHQHYSNLDILRVLGEPETAIKHALECNPNSLVVMGAYGRSSLSMLFHHSTADSLLQSKKIPAFITHN